MFKTFLCLMCAVIVADADAADYLELRHFQLIDGTGAASRPVERLVACDGVIIAIDGEGNVQVAGPNERWTRIDLDGAWVMPGLVDTHVHVARFPDAFVQAERILGEAVRGGVTAVRDLGGDARALAEIRRRIVADDARFPSLKYGAMFGGPDIFKGPPINQFASGFAVGEAPWTLVVNAKTDLSLAIARAKGAGADHIKIYGHLSPALAARIIAEAHRQDLLTVAHATVFTASPGDLVDAGIGTLSHAPYLVWQAVENVPGDYGMRIKGPWADVAPDHPRLLALYRRMAERGVFLDATLYVYRMMKEALPRDIDSTWADAAFEWAAQATRAAHRAGVRVTASTDWFEPCEGELPHTHDELALLVNEAGFTPMEAIVAGTRNGAIAMGLGETHGTLEIGKFADLLVLEANPLVDIGNTKRLRRVVLRGMPMD